VWLTQLVTIERFKTSNAPSPNLTKSFTYGPLDRRWSTIENGVKTDYVYDQSDRIAALDQSGNVNQRVTFGPAVDEPFAITGQSSTNYLHANHIGSVVGTSSSGVTLGEYRYSPFGKRLQAPEPALDNPFQYAGREYEGDGLYYNRARYYDSVSSRFISEDPLGTFPGNTNLYTYAQNNPIHGTDPSGRIVMFAIPALYFAVEVGLSLYDAYDTVSTLVDPCLSAGEKWLAGGLWVLGAIAPGGGYTAADDIARGVAKSVAPNAAQAKNLKRFQKKIPSNSKENVELRGLPNNGVAVQASSAGKVPGSRAVYEKQIDVNGKTIQATKTTYNPQGNIVHVKDKLNGGTYP
jgi:RHS repeat-associated protein